MSVATEIERLRQEIRRHDRKYYVEAAPEISDYEYDLLLERLRKLEAEHPELITPDSPTQRVGEEPVEHLEQFAHRLPMLSIDNTYDLDELRRFGDRVHRALEGEAVAWTVEYKVDGVAAAIIYEHGSLTQALTRGNGRVGDDITHNVRTIDDVPLRLLVDDPPPLLEVRGEIYMANSELVRLNEQQVARGEAPYANTRNVTAGLIRRLDPRQVAPVDLRMVCHGVGAHQGLRATTYSDFLAEIRGYGLVAAPHARTFTDFESAVAHCDAMIESLHELDYEVDGLVLKVNRFDQRERLGNTSKSPRWLVAYKWEKYEQTTKLLDIQVQVGKTGAITPVAHLKPVEIAGTIVSRASLHNAEEIARLDARIGDVVVVEKAGKIIPHVVRVEKHERTAELPAFAFPTRCPRCDTELVRDEGGVYIRCPNMQSCPAQLEGRLRYFASRNAMDIEGLGETLVEQLVGHGCVRRLGDLYRLRAADVQQLERMGKRSSDKLIAGIEASKPRGLARLLNALSIRHVGQGTAAVLARHFRDMEALTAASVEQLAAVDEIGPIIAESVHAYLQSPFGRETIADLAAQGVSMASEEPEESSPLLQGKTFVVTGSLTRYTRDQINALIRRHGGKASSSVSRKTDYVVAGEKAGSKLGKAEELGVPVLSEDDFAKLVAGEPR